MEDYVSHIGDRTVQIVASAPGNVKIIREIGGVADGSGGDTCRIKCAKEDELVRVLQAILDADLAFVGGNAGWPPAAVAVLLRDKGKLHGTIREAMWSGPNQQRVQGR